MACILATLKGLLKGITFCFYLYFTTLFGSIFIMGPAYPLLFLHQSTFRRYQDFWLGVWLWLPGSLIELFGTKLVICGDPVDRNARPLIIMNHRCRLDWMFYWMGLQRYGRLQNVKIIMKHELKLIPGPGWAMQNGMFLFLKRRWEQDEGYLARVLHYFQQVDYPLQMFIFPEGTNLEKGAIEKSHSFADKNGLPRYEYVLHPRVTGFNYIVKKLRGNILESIHDVTVGYKANECYGEKDLLFGKFPEEIHLHIKEFKMADIPAEPEALGEWCAQRWAEKEEKLKKFYAEDFKFTRKGDSDEAADKRLNGDCTFYKTLTLVFWTVFTFGSFYAVYVNAFAFWYSIIMMVFYASITVLGNGVDELQLNIHEFRSSFTKRD